MTLQRQCNPVGLSFRVPQEVNANWIHTFVTSAGYEILQEFLKTIAQITALEIRLLHVFCLLELLLMKLLLECQLVAPVPRHLLLHQGTQRLLVVLV